jgi:hypothetical protein
MGAPIRVNIKYYRTILSESQNLKVGILVMIIWPADREMGPITCMMKILKICLQNKHHFRRRDKESNIGKYILRQCVLCTLDVHETSKEMA